MNIPKRLKFKSDGNEVEFLKIITHDSGGVKRKEPLFVFVYVLSKCKMGLELSISENDLEDIIRKEIAEEI